MTNVYEKTLYRTKYLIKTGLALIKEIFSFEKLDIDYDDSVLFLLACDYNNIGDALIRESQMDFLRKYSKKKVVAVDYSKTFAYLKDIRKNASRKTVIALTGGGNTDDRYTGIEIARNQIIMQLASSGCKIIGFPQTMDYRNTKRGEYYKRKTIKACGRNLNYVFTAREKKTYTDAKKLFVRNRILLTPDIVFSHCAVKGSAKKRDNVGLLLRSDEEQSEDSGRMRGLLDRMSKRYSLEKNDMTVSDFDGEKCEAYIKEKIDFVTSKKLVITDRLHGMVLCYITNTPCIVFPSCNHKIEETYNNWLRDTQNFIHLMRRSDFGNFDEIVDGLFDLKTISKSSLNEYFLPLIREIGND